MVPYEPFFAYWLLIFSPILLRPEDIRDAGVFSPFNIYIERIFSSCKKGGGGFVFPCWFCLGKTDANDAL